MTNAGGVSSDQIRANLERVTARIAAAAERAGRADVPEIVAVTKGHPASAVNELIEAGITAIGENRAQELLAKAEELAGSQEHVGCEWHFVGRIQRNKISKLVDRVSVWHSVDRLEAAEAIARRSPGARIYVQVDVGGEEQKGGCSPGETASLVGAFRALGLDVAGLMTVPPLADDPRPHFARLRELAAEAGTEGLSMGMSGDYAVAVEEGATVVRLGTALLGSRPDPP